MYSFSSKPLEPNSVSITPINKLGESVGWLPEEGKDGITTLTYMSLPEQPDCRPTSCVQQLIIPERLNQIYIVAYRWKGKILSFATMCHSSKSIVSNLKGQATIVAQRVSEKVLSESILYLRLALINQR